MHPGLALDLSTLGFLKLSSRWTRKPEIQLINNFWILFDLHQRTSVLYTEIKCMPQYDVLNMMLMMLNDMINLKTTFLQNTVTNQQNQLVGPQLYN